MLPIRIGLASRSASIGLADLTAAAAAIDLQITRDLAPIWNVSASVTALSDPDAIPPGVWPAFVVDDTGQEGADGLHLTDHNQPYALIEAGTTWTLTASHECLEMVVDPSGNRLVSSAAIALNAERTDAVDLPGEKFEYLVEVADPSEDQANAYYVDGVLVSDFYTPHFFDPVSAGGVRYSFSGKLVRPRQVLQGGYLSWLNPVRSQLQQLRWWGNGPEIVDVPGRFRESRTTLRGAVDAFAGTRRRLSHLETSSALVTLAKQRAAWLDHAASIRSAAYVVPDLVLSAALRAAPQEAQRVLDANVERLKAAGATKAYVGWSFDNGWISHRRALVVVAAPNAVDSVRNRLPDAMDGVPVEVRPDNRPILSASPQQTLFASAVSGTVREELALPSFPGEHYFDGTDPAALLAARRSKPAVTYVPPEGVILDEKEYQVDALTIHISPEQGWAQLKPFLAQTEQALTVGMYEFTAPHIDKALTDAMSDPRALTMTMDSPAEKKGKREQTVEDTEHDLDTALGNRFDFAWALSGLGKEAVAKAFPTAYHIKVAVRDRNSFWLSSGNWNTSNQPDIDPDDQDALVQAIRNNDRDWHLICQCQELAELFERFLEADYRLAETTADQSHAGVAAAARPELSFSPLDMLTLSAGSPRRFFPPKTVSGTISLQPLLTPDNYRKPILDLIRSAKQRFYMQTQYIHTTDDDTDEGNLQNGDVKHMDLIRAVAQLIDNGVDVRLITSEFQTKDWIEKLQDAGVDASNHLRLQQNVHNKGIVVDSSVAVISSQNWSGQGTGRNRDAGLLIRNAEVAQYLEEIFLHDWVNLTSDTQSAE